MRFATLTLVLAMLWTPRPAVAQQLFGLIPPGLNVPLPPLGSQVASLVVNTPQGKRLGTAFCVSKEGYVATSFHNVQNALSATVVSSNGITAPVTLQVTGAVAVNKARDLVILATSLKQVVPNMTFDPKAEPANQTILLPQPGPLSKPLLDLVPRTPVRVPYLPHVQGRGTGEEFLRGLKNDGPVGLGTDPTLDWMLLDVPLDVTYTGAPVWNETYTAVVGMVSAVGDDTPGVRYVLPIRNVLELVPQNPPPVIPLPKLAKWEDPKHLPPAPDVAKLWGETSVTRWEYKFESRTKLETDAATLKQLKAKFEGETNKAIQLINAAATRINTMQPEERHTRREVVTTTERDKAGRKVEKEKYQTVTEYEFSARQKRERQNLTLDIFSNQMTMLVSTLHGEMIDNNLLPHAQRRFNESTIEVFLAADPLELRPLEELEPLRKKLDEQIRQGGVEPLNYLLRAVILTRQRDGAAARNDLAQMILLNPQYTPLKVALERRLENFENKTQLSAPQQNFKSPLLEMLVPLVAARIEWDNGDGKAAAKILARWLPSHQRHADVHTALAWEMLETNPPNAVTNRQALQAAWDAVELSRGRDWLALGALAAAQVRAKDYQKAEATMIYLAPLMPAEKIALRDAWQKAVTAKEPPLRMP